MEIEITKMPVKIVGSCNSCNRINNDGSSPYQVVTEIRMRTSSFRLCNDCLKDLKKIISSL